MFPTIAFLFILCYNTAVEETARRFSFLEIQRIIQKQGRWTAPVSPRGGIVCTTVSDIANGEGVRVTLFVSGCTNHCEHCFQPQTWDFDYGQPFTSETEQQLLDLLAPSYIQGLTLLGGEPFEPENQRVLVPFVRRVRETYPQKTVWAFSGFTLEELRTEGSHPRCEATDELLSMLDVLVDGRFVEALKDISLRFRGSSNQRLIDMKKTLASGEIVLLPDLDRKPGQA